MTPDLWAPWQKFLLLPTLQQNNIRMQAARWWAPGCRAKYFKAPRFFLSPSPLGTLLVGWFVDQSISSQHYWVNQSVKWSASPYLCASIRLPVRWSGHQHSTFIGSVNRSVSPSVISGSKVVTRQEGQVSSVSQWIIRLVTCFTGLIELFCLTRWLHVWTCLHRRMAYVWTVNKSNDKCATEEYHSDSEQNAEYAYTKTL